MRPIPKKLRDELQNDEYYKRCARDIDGDCKGRITWEHAFIYAGKQINAKWAIIPLCWYHHIGKGLNKDKNQWIALKRACPGDFKTHPKKDWEQSLRYLENKAKTENWPKYRLKGYYHFRNGKWVDMDWGNKIAENLKRNPKRIHTFICGGCGKKQEGDVNKRFCDYNCKYLTLKKTPFKYKARTLTSTITLQKRGEIVEKMLREAVGKPCDYCKEEITLENASLDHKTPLNKRRTKMTAEEKRAIDVPENLHIVCKSCNQRKGNMNDAQYKKLLAFLDENPELKSLVFQRFAQGTIMWNFKRRATGKR